MPATITEKIIARHAGRGSVTPGEAVEVAVDQTWSDDLGARLTLSLLEQNGIRKVFDTKRVFITLMVNAPARDIQAASVLRDIRALAAKYGITEIYEMGNAAIHNSVGIEAGLTLPGDLIVGGNSHACMPGALGCYATGMGSTDIAAILATGKTWIEVPRTVRYRFEGKPGKWVMGKDYMLKLIGKIGVAGGKDGAIEFAGPAIEALEVEERLSMTNMAIEAGAQNAIVEPDDKALAYAKARARRPFEPVWGDKDARVEEIVIPVEGMEPVISLPHLPSNTKPLSEVKGAHLDQVYIGSCTNGWIHDLRIAASILKGRRVKEGLRVFDIPGTTEIYKQAMKEGLAEIFVEAGAAFSTPTCGPCIGAHFGVLGDGERSLSTSNRNFRGRQGSTKSETYLCNPAVAAASAIKGVVCGPDDI